VRVPFVGCASDGQAGPVEAPRGVDEVVLMKASAAKRLAYYKAAVAPGVLAPRGWYCLGTYGSASSGLIVAPRPIKAEDAFSGGIAGPAVEADDVDGGTSGRFEVADVLAHVFPAQRSFVQRVIDSGDQQASDYKFLPYPNDMLIVQKDRLVEYQTAPRSEGLGTMSRLKPNDDPIDGLRSWKGKRPIC
jgi:hypothetical protein